MQLSICMYFFLISRHDPCTTCNELLVCSLKQRTQDSDSDFGKIGTTSYVLSRSRSQSFGVNWSRSRLQAFHFVVFFFSFALRVHYLNRIRPTQDDSERLRTNLTPDDSARFRLRTTPQFFDSAIFRFRATPGDSVLLWTTPNDSE